MGYTLSQHHQLVTYNAYYQLIFGQLYNMGEYGIVCRCSLDHEQDPILYEAHEVIVEGHNAGKATTCKPLMDVALC
jgi:hypothetical protein